MQRFGFVQMLYTLNRQVWIRGNTHSNGWAYAHITSSNGSFDVEYSSEDFWWRADDKGRRVVFGNPSEKDAEVIKELLKISGLEK